MIKQPESIIPQKVLININTKLILGNEMYRKKSSKQSTEQDLSDDSRNIAAWIKIH